MFICRISIFECIDFDNISSLRNIANWFDFSVYDSVFEAQSNIAMNSESKIQDSASNRKLYNISLWSIEENAFFQNLNIKLLFKLFFIIYWCIIINNFLKFFDPFSLLLRNFYRCVVFCICKMCSYSKFGLSSISWVLIWISIGKRNIPRTVVWILW